MTLCSSLIFMHLASFAQIDTLPDKKEVPAENHKNIFSKVMNNFRRDTTEVDQANELKRNDAYYTRYRGRIIRNISIKKLPFGIPFSDTSKNLITSLTRLANKLHHITKTQVIRNNLFFKSYDTLQPYLMADNERFLRQLPYVQEAGIIVVPIGTDSVDIIVVEKDVFSLGGAITSLGLKKSEVQVREDNIGGSGNAGVLYSLFDAGRKRKFAFGAEYNPRNIGGSFIDGTVGYQSFYPSIIGPRQENNYYVNLVKPLINRYMHWTYELDLSYHSTRNMYTNDSVYQSSNKYKYYNIEAWAGYNINATEFSMQQESKKLRKLVGLRIINQKFQEVPDKYASSYFWRFADLTGVLGSVTFYRQNFYKTQYIYGFGRNEDIPEGLLMSITTGYTIKQGLSRPFLGFNYERYGFNDRKNYLGYTIRAEGFLNNKSIEDINLLGEINYFDHLKTLGTKWKQRFFLNFGVAQQVNTVLNQPLYANSQFGLHEYGLNQFGGGLRATVKAESVFFSPWSLVAFRFAPFVFSNAGVFSPYVSKTMLLSSVGGGIRTRNESFIFGTIEVRGYYFPQKNFYHERFGIDISTNVIFKYTSDFVKKPDFIQIN
jgi:hypothetical protein